MSILIPNTQIAMLLATPITMSGVVVAGFYIPFQNMNQVLEAVSYLSFARYGYSALL